MLASCGANVLPVLRFERSCASGLVVCAVVLFRTGLCLSAICGAGGFLQLVLSGRYVHACYVCLVFAMSSPVPHSLSVRQSVCAGRLFMRVCRFVRPSGVCAATVFPK